MPDDAFTSPRTDKARTPLQALAAVVSPDSWRAAEHGDLLSPLLVVALVAATLQFSLGAYRGVDAYLGGRGMGPAYDAAYDPIVVRRDQAFILGTVVARFNQR